MLSTLLSIAAIVIPWGIAIALSIRVLTRRRPRGSSFAWIILMLAIPYLGALLYILVGELWLPFKRVERVREQHDDDQPLRIAQGDPSRPDPGVDARLVEKLERLAIDATGHALAPGNDIALLDDAHATFDRIAEDINAATTRCYLLFYIWHDGGKTEQVARALINAAARGVDCRVLVDAHGSESFLSGPVAEALREGGVKVRAAFPVGRIRLKLARIDIRNHRKIVVIDDHTGYVGSLNLADPDCFKRDAGVGPWVDCAVRLNGPCVEYLARTFLADWSIEHPNEQGENESSSRVDPEAHHHPDRVDYDADHDPTTHANILAQVLPSGPGQDPLVLRQMLHTLIYSARERVVITTPYFVPGEATAAAIMTAARGGVAVDLIIPEKIDSPLVALASSAYFAELMDAGVRIHRFRGGLLHSKTVTIDDSIAMLGSANMDLRSFEINLEISLFVYDRRFAETLNALQQKYIEQSVPLDPQRWARRSHPRVLMENTAQLFAPLL
ncbi:MAG: cardiolipin synthase [Phycisphaerales bacterium]